MCVWPDDVTDFSAAEADVSQEERQEVSHTESSVTYSQDESDARVRRIIMLVFSCILVLSESCETLHCDNLYQALHIILALTKKCDENDKDIFTAITLHKMHIRNMLCLHKNEMIQVKNTNYL